MYLIKLSVSVKSINIAVMYNKCLTACLVKGLGFMAQSPVLEGRV